MFGGEKIAKYYRLNQNINSKELRVIDADGSQLGVISKEEALAKAQSAGLDLVEIAPNVNPPVARILDFEKFRYEESKKEQAAKKRTKDVQLKELWFSPRIAEHDLDTRVKKAEEFLKDNNKVLVRIKFKGREMAHQNLGFEVINKIFKKLEGKIVIEREPKFEGRSITAIIGKGNAKIKKEEGHAEN